MATLTADDLTEDQLEQLGELLRPRFSKYIPHDPYEWGKENVKQAAVMLLDDYIEVLYGGAAGGGKSDAILMMALQYVDVPGYSALILRRTFPQLSQPDGIMTRAHEWLRGTDAKWNNEKHEWTFPSGATLKFGHLQTEADKWNYQGGAYQFIGFDELTQFMESMYVYLFSRLRRLTGSTVPLRVRSASNPGGIGHAWVFKRFLKSHIAFREGKGPAPIRGPRVDAEDEEFIAFAEKVADPVIPTTVFIPASLNDNKHLDASYRVALAQLSYVERQQLEFGDWMVKPEGNMFKERWFGILERRHVPNRPRFRLRMWDLAASEKETQGDDPDWTVGELWCLTDRGVFICEDVVRFQGSPGEVEDTIKNVATRDGRGVAIGIEQEGGSAGKSLMHVYYRLLKDYEVIRIKPTGDKVTRARAYSSAAQHGLVQLVEATWNDEFILEHTLFKQKGVHDDQVDAGAYAINLISEILDLDADPGEDEHDDPRLRGRR